MSRPGTPAFGVIRGSSYWACERGLGRARSCSDLPECKTFAKPCAFIANNRLSRSAPVSLGKRARSLDLPGTRAPYSRFVFRIPVDNSRDSVENSEQFHRSLLDSCDFIGFDWPGSVPPTYVRLTPTGNAERRGAMKVQTVHTFRVCDRAFALHSPHSNHRPEIPRDPASAARLLANAP